MTKPIRLPPGRDPPNDVYVFVEISSGSNVKYEYDEELGMVIVDRVLYTAMFYPFNYGFIPNTEMEDGDPVDVLLISSVPFMPGTVVRARPIGLLEMEDEEGIDHKVIAVPIAKVDPRLANVKDLKDLPEAVLDQIRHFFEHYKELEPGKWTKVRQFKGVEEARKIILESVERAGKRATQHV